VKWGDFLVELVTVVNYQKKLAHFIALSITSESLPSRQTCQILLSSAHYKEIVHTEYYILIEGNACRLLHE
jgi:hypothetical protein